MAGSDSKRQEESELDLARERLAFYEQFDEIIRQNIASSSALLREASTRHEADFVAERSQFRALLSGMLDDLSALQSQSERLARRVTDALDDLESGATLTAEGVAPEATTLGMFADAPPEAAAVVNAATRATRKLAEPVANSGAKKFAAAELPASPAVPVAAVAAIDFSNPTTTTLLVHGVPRASAALGLKSYIEKLDFVSTVEPREFAAGLLRLQVDGARPLSLGDLAGWTLADRVKLRSASNDLLELDLTPA